MPAQNIKIALLPFDINFGETINNLHRVIDMINMLENDTNLVVLPEMFNSGFTPDYDTAITIAEPTDGPILIQLSNIAQSRNIAISGGLSAKETDGKLYNRGFFISPEGNIAFYDKRHLFRYGGESDIYTPGNEPSPIINFMSWNIKLSICYDIRFPVWNRAINNDYDLLIVPANWAHSRVYAWRQLLIARAIENQCYVAGCNREGHDNYGKYQPGDSWIFDESGREISHTDENGIIYGLLDAEKFNTTRQRFTTWRDADLFNLTFE